MNPIYSSLLRERGLVAFPSAGAPRLESLPPLTVRRVSVWAVAATPVLVVAVFVAAVVGEARLRRRNRVVSARLEAQL